MDFSHQNAPTNFALNEKNHKFYCKYCDYGCDKKSNYTRHIATRKHSVKKRAAENEPKQAKTSQKTRNFKKKSKKNPKKSKKNENTGVVCKFCNFQTKHLGTFNRHLKTKKHIRNFQKVQNMIKKNEIITNLSKKRKEIDDKIKFIECDEEKIEILTSLSNQENCQDNIIIYENEKKHQHQQNFNSDNFNSDNFNNNIEIKNNRSENDNEKHTHYHYHVTNYTYNNSFNMQLFLQENCQNAMNLTDFVKNIKYNNQTWNSLISEEDLYDTFTNMVVKELEDMDVTERPIHCSDKKLNTVYVRDNNLWEKDNENIKLTHAVDEIHKNHNNMTTQIIKEWREKHPNWVENDIDCEEIHKATANKIKCSKKVNHTKFMKKIIDTTVLDSDNGRLSPPKIK